MLDNEVFFWYALFAGFALMANGAYRVYKITKEDEESKKKERRYG